MELWPRRGERDGDAAGREEEERAQQFPGKINLNWWVGWARKDKVEL